MNGIAKWRARERERLRWHDIGAQKSDCEQDQKNHPHDHPRDWVSFEQKVCRHSAYDKKPKDHHQRVASSNLCNARKIDHLVFSEIADLFVLDAITAGPGRPR